VQTAVHIAPDGCYGCPHSRGGRTTVIARAEDGEGQVAQKRRPNRIEQILESALLLFDRHGYYATGMDDIGEATGLTGPAIYRHFSSKEEILARLISERATRSLELARKIASAKGSPEEKLRNLIIFYADELIDSPELASVAFYNRRSLSGETREAVERLERHHIDVWVRTLRAVRPALTPGEARLVVQGVVGMTVAATSGPSRKLPRDRRHSLIADMMTAAMLGCPEQPLRAG